MSEKMKQKWLSNYRELSSYIDEHHQLPDKRIVENRRLLNWWKYNMRCLKRGTLDADKARMLEELGNRRTVHL